MTAIFISHSSTDAAAAARMKAWLEGQGHTSLFLDFDPATGIRAGTSWEQTLYRELRRCQAVVALASPAWLASRWCFAEMVQARERGKPIFVVKVEPVDTSSVFPDIQHIDLTVNAEQGFERLRIGLLDRGIDPLDAFDWDASRPPFPGLLAFEEADAAIFFGRGEALARTLEALDAQRRQAADAARFVLLLGASGSGKSSLARAGVIPRLRKRTAEWLPVPPMRPQQEPVDELAAALAAAFTAGGASRDWKDLRQHLRRAAEDSPAGGEQLLDLTRELAVVLRQPDATVLLTVDQAEELFAYTPPTATERFLRLVRSALEQGDRRLMVLATLRSDFLGQFQSHPALQDKEFGHHLRYRAVTVDPMPLRSVPEIIRGPARLAGIELEDGLVQAMVDDIGDQDALPLLAFTLRRIYERSAGSGRMTLADYEAVGRLEGSVRQEAERILSEAQPAPEDFDALHAAFVPALVRINSDGSYARRRAVVDSLPHRVLALLRRFVDARLLVSDRDAQGRETHEVAHEALLRTWPQLGEWLASDRDQLRLLESLSRAAVEWDQGGRNSDLLVHRDGRLQDLETLLADPRFALPAASVEVAYADACRAAQQAREQAARSEQERRLRDAERIAEEQTKAAAAQRRAASIFRRLGIVAGVMFIIATAAALVAREQYGQAVQANQRVADVQRIGRHVSDSAVGPQRGLLLSVQAARLQPSDATGTLAAIDGLRRQLRMAGGTPLSGHTRPLSVAAFSPDGRWLVTGDADGVLLARDLEGEGAAPPSQPLPGHRRAISGIAFAADGRQFVSSSADGTVRSWRFEGTQVQAGRVLNVGEAGAVRSLASSPDGKWLALGTERGFLCLWRWTDDGPEQSSCDPSWKDDQPVAQVRFSPKGRWLAATCTGACRNFSQPVRLWDMSGGSGADGPRSLAHRGELTEPSLLGIAFSNDERLLAVAYGYVAEVWDLTQADPPSRVVGTYAGSGGWIQSLDMHPDGTWLALGSGSSAKVKVWRVGDERQPPLELDGHDGPVNAVAFDSTGHWLGSAAADGSVRLWDFGRPAFPSVPLRGHDLSVAGLRFAPGAEPKQIVTWGADLAPRLWQLPDGLADPVVFKAQVGANIMSMAVSPDGHWLATSSDGDRKLTLWSARDPRRPVTTLDVPGMARSLAFSADGRWLAAKSQDQGRISVWSLQDLALPPVELVEGDWSDDRTLAFSPDSRWLASGTAGHNAPARLNLWDVSKGPPSIEPQHRCRPTSVRELAFSADGKLLATAAQGNVARLWKMNAANPCEAPVRLPHDNVVYQLTVSPDNRWAASASFDGKGRLWDLSAGAEPRLVREVDFEDRVLRAVFSPDGRWAAFASWDRSAALLDLQAPAAPPIRLRGHVGRVLATAFSPDGNWLATAGEDRTIRLWSPLAPGVAPVVLRGHEASVPHLAFMPDGSRLVSGAYDGSVRQWRMGLADLVRLACFVAGRELTAAEVEQYLGGAAVATPCDHTLEAATAKSGSAARGAMAPAR